MEQEDEDEYIPLQNQSVVGAGLKRKRIQFVPAATTTVSPQPLPPAKNAAQRYLSIVQGNAATQTEKQADGEDTKGSTTGAAASCTEELQDDRCEICNLPITSITDISTGEPKPHEASLVHQVCLTHSHPPSHLDRTRTGLKYLSSYGWDPDSRLGLGAKGEGVRVPLKAKVKNDTVGLGVERAIRKGQAVSEKKVERLDAKGVRRKEVEAKKRGERLQQMFYGKDDVDKYLGTAV